MARGRDEAVTGEMGALGPIGLVLSATFNIEMNTAVDRCTVLYSTVAILECSCAEGFC